MTVSSADPGVTLPRGMVIARAWADLGDAVAPLSNASGHPLARTVKLLLDPLVLRPVLNPHLASGAVAAEHADELRAAIVAAGPALAATAAWFQLLKKARRKAGITDGHPQDLYFQHCYELAHRYGHPESTPDAARVASGSIADLHAPADRLTVAELRRFVTDPANRAELTRLLRAVWSVPREQEHVPADAGVTGFLATCATDPDPRLFSSLVARAAGTGGAGELAQPGVARSYGLTDRSRITPPELGDSASKRQLPRPLDRSVFERLFAAFRQVAADDADTVVRAEIHRTAQPWQLADEASRVVMVLGREASAGLSGEQATGAGGRLRSRWAREAYVRRVLRMPSAVPGDLLADVHGVRGAYLRRLWVRLHGRELRREPLAAVELWSLLDGVLRSVIMDQRDRLRSALERAVR
ncbi:hypothetical protein [Actinophytocola sp. NPDC049390]|uniref:hypothetical protein n=1 Tax=Actinophytocola sp. NPDC049390 TaxID=3363894 RepID=UPI00379D6B37